MARRQATGEIRISAVPTIADVTAPTLAEISAGVEMEGSLTRGGLSTPDSGDTIDSADLSSRFNATQRGNHGGDTVTITAHRDSTTADDEAWATLHPEYDGHLVIRRFGGSSVAFAAGDNVEVWTISVTSRAMADAGNETQRFTASAAVTAEVEYDAVVAA